MMRPVMELSAAIDWQVGACDAMVNSTLGSYQKLSDWQDCSMNVQAQPVTLPTRLDATETGSGRELADELYLAAAAM
jgi:hypothetical protein